MTTCTCPFTERGRFALDAACPIHGQPLSAGCAAIAEAKAAIIQTVEGSREQALRQFADKAGERHDD